MSDRESTIIGKFCGVMFLLVWHSQVFCIQGLKLELPVERDDCANVLDGLCSNLLGDTRRIQDHKYTKLSKIGAISSLTELKNT